MKNGKLSKGTSTKEILEENEKMIKFLTIFGIIFTIVYVILIIAWIYCKNKGI